jgi:hypothetical protein
MSEESRPYQGEGGRERTGKIMHEPWCTQNRVRKRPLFLLKGRSFGKSSVSIWEWACWEVVCWEVVCWEVVCWEVVCWEVVCWEVVGLPRNDCCGRGEY